MTEAFAIESGGWDERYAVVLAVVTSGDVAAALVDPHGDGGDLDLDEYHRGPDGRWVGDTSHGSASDSGTTWSPHLVATYGRTVPNAEIFVDYVGETHTVTANDAGWWLFVTESLDEGTLPGSRSND